MSANRAPRGIWSDRTVIWISDSGQDKLFAHDLASGERLPERDIVLDKRNDDPRGIWSDETAMWVLDSRDDTLFGYDLASGALLAEYELASTNGDPHGIWSDGVTVWVSDHGAKRLFAYRLPVLPDDEADSGEEDTEDGARELERVRDEEFPNTVLSKAGNNSPRGLWSDGDVMYVADQSGDKVYTYNMPDAIDARLASLSLSGVDIGEFASDQPEYAGVVDDGVTVTTVAAEAAQDDAVVVIAPADADEDCRWPSGRGRGRRGDHGHRHLGGRQPREDLQRAPRGDRAVRNLPARRGRRGLQPRRLRGRQHRGPRGLRGGPRRDGALRTRRR